jgi:FMN phosphatase YigB (HAD superfamily)
MEATLRIAAFEGLRSMLEQTPIAARVVGFDIFDTLLVRAVEPEWVKTAASHRLWQRLCDLLHPQQRPEASEVRRRRRELEDQIANERVAAGEDNEVDYERLLQRWIGAWLPPGTERTRLIEATRRHELELEAKVLTPAPGIENVLRWLRDDVGKRLIFVSDMYHGAAVLWRLLDGCGLAGYFAAGYSSTDHGRRKATGRLFEKILELEGLQPCELLFIGDNPSSDGEQPRRLGISSILVSDSLQRHRRRRMQLAHWAVERNPGFFSAQLADEIVRSVPRKVEPADDIDYRTGRLLAPSLVAFVLYLVEKCKALGIKRIYFLAREGLSLQRIFRIFRQKGLPEAQSLRDGYLFLSRASTMLASMRSLSWEEIWRFWWQYDHQSLRTLLRNLSLPAEQLLRLGADAGLTDPDRPIEEPGDSAFQRFLRSRPVLAIFDEERDRARDLLVRYLRRRGLFGEDRVAFVDIGWKGSIQDNVVHSISLERDAPEIHGFYFGFMEPRVAAPAGSFKYGYMADSRRGSAEESDLFRNGSIFEMATTANHGSAVGFQPGPHAPEIPLAVLEHHELERANYERFFRRMQKAIFDYAEDFATMSDFVPFTAEEMKPGLLADLLRYLRYPTREEADRFLEYSHVEGFGVHEVTTYEFKGEAKRILTAGMPRKMAAELIAALDRTSWREAAVRRSGVPFANLIFDAWYAMRRS